MSDSRKAGPGSLFFCIKGAVSDGHTYAKEVAEKAPSVLIVQVLVEVPKQVTVIQVPRTAAMPWRAFQQPGFDHPAEN